MACTDGPTKIWAAAGGSTFTQRIQGPATGGFSAVATVFEGGQPAAFMQLPLSIPLKPNTNYFVVTQVVIVTRESISVEVSSAIGGQAHCTTVTGSNPTTANVDHTILVG